MMPIGLWLRMTREFVMHPSWWFGRWDTPENHVYLNKIIDEYVERHS